jgi:predicted transcriptional regulator
MKIPCEIIVWQILPVIRKEFAKNMIENHKLTQKKTAQKLGLTEAAVSRYVSGKRGTSEILDGEILNEISKSVNQIVEGNGTSMIEETCRICGLLKASGMIKGINYACK